MGGLEASLYVQSDKECTTVLRSQFNERKEENQELSDKLSKMKIDYLRTLSSNTGSAASKLRRGMTLEIDDCKFCFEAMKTPHYQPLVDNKKIIENLQERITLMNMHLITKREDNEKIIKVIKDLKKVDQRLKEKEQDIEKEMKIKFILSCNHPVTGKLINSFLKVHKDELLPVVLDKAYKLMKLAPHIPIERCRLVKYDYSFDVMEQSFDLDEFQHQTILQLMGMDGYYDLFLETRKETESFKKYNDGGIKLKISVVDVSTGEVRPVKPMRGEVGWTIEGLKQYIGEVFDLNSSCMRLVQVYGYQDITSIWEVTCRKLTSTIENILRGNRSSPYRQFYVSSDPEDCEKEFEDSLMYKYVDYYINWIQLNITLPPQPEVTATTSKRREGEIIMKIISMNEQKRGKERNLQVEVDRRITLAQLKEELAPLIGVQPTGFIVYRISGSKANEMKELDGTLKYITSGSELIVRLHVGRAVQEGGYCKIKLYLLQVNNTEFCEFMMESIVTKGTPVREFKKQIIEEAKVQGIDCVLELDKMRLREKWGVSTGNLFLDDQLIHASGGIYLEQLKQPEKKKYDRQRQVYVIRWRPSQCSVDPTEEIIMDDNYDPRHVIEKLSELSGVSAEYITYAKSTSFPLKISCLNIENQLEWKYSLRLKQHFSLYDGCVIYYKDSREKMKELTDRERSEIQEAEEARLKKI
uniref:Ubiquitin carboxyl-terminal hydrolase 47 C-terminal domain-containing protein n=1 Tax=Amphimedon queenslandica TaxID=400682 RepID=A0A1X7UPU2_AMPQE